MLTLRTTKGSELTWVELDQNFTFLEGLINDAQDTINLKQDTLIDTVNIKTINGNSLLGEGDLTIVGSPFVETSNGFGVYDKTNTSNLLLELTDSTNMILNNTSNLNYIEGNGTNNFLVGQSNAVEGDRIFGGILYSGDCNILSGYGNVVNGERNVVSGYMNVSYGTNADNVVNGYENISYGSESIVSNMFGLDIAGFGITAVFEGTNGDYANAVFGQANNMGGQLSLVCGDSNNISSDVYTGVTGGFYNAVNADGALTVGGQLINSVPANLSNYGKAVLGYGNVPKQDTKLEVGIGIGIGTGFDLQDTYTSVTIPLSSLILHNGLTLDAVNNKIMFNGVLNTEVFQPDYTPSIKIPYFEIPSTYFNIGDLISIDWELDDNKYREYNGARWYFSIDRNHFSLTYLDGCTIIKNSANTVKFYYMGNLGSYNNKDISLLNGDIKISKVTLNSVNRKNGFEIYNDGRVHAPELTTNLITDPKCLVTKEYVDAPRATTIDGYGITDAYTKTQVDASLNAKQTTLVSGTNIKTINGVSVLGTGDITIAAGGIQKARFTATEGQLAFVCTGITLNDPLVYLNGILQDQGDVYTYAASTVTFVSARYLNEKIVVVQ